MSAQGAAVQAETMTLFDWDAGDRIPDDFYLRMTRHPQFATAARGLATSSVATALGDPIMRDICKDAGRYVAGLGVISLDVAGEVTLPKLKDLCARSGMLSAGRVRSFLQYLQHVGWLDLVRPGRAAVPAVYAPSPRFRALWTDHLRGPIAAAALIAAEAGLLLARLDDPGVRATFLRLQGASLFDGAAQPQPNPVFAVFYHPLAALQILSMLTGRGSGERFPDPSPAVLSINGVARDLGVSRVQVKRILANAVAAGLLEVSPTGHALTERAAEPLRFIYAAQLIRLLVPISRTLRAHGLA